jgi:hypothetical protein
LAFAIASIGCNAVFDIHAREARPKEDSGLRACVAMLCGDQMIDTCTHEAHCGACGNVCDKSTPTLRCIGGSCVDHRWPKGELTERPNCTLADGTSGQVLYDERAGLFWTATSVGEALRVEAGEELCSRLQFGELTGFRMPTRAELIELVDYADGVISDDCTKDTPDVVQPYRQYCSSSPAGPYLYGIESPSGRVGEAAIDTPCFVRCVRATRGGPRTRFTALASGKIRDEVTRLDWERDVGLNADVMTDRTFFTFQQARDYCAAKGMRLPTAKQLMSLVDERARPGEPTIDPIFPATPLDFFWTETGSTKTQTYEMVVDFRRGFSSMHPRIELARVRCMQDATP